MRPRHHRRYSAALPLPLPLPLPNAALRRSIHLAAALALVLTLGWVPAGLAAPASARQNGDLPGVDGSTYESPTWGYTVEWDDDVWDVRLSRSNNNNDRLLLTRPGGDILLYIDGYDFFNIDPVSCIEGGLAKLENRTAVAEIAPYEAPDGELVAGEEEDRAFAAYRYTVERSGATEAQVQYNECRTIVPGEAVVEITHIAPADVYEDEAALVAGVLATLTIPAGEADDDATPEIATPDATPDEATPAATPDAEDDDATPTLTATPDDDEATTEVTPTAEATAATEDATEEATAEPTLEAADDEPTEAPTEAATEEPEPTEEPTEEATEEPTEEATEEPEDEDATEEATEEPTEEPEDEEATEEPEDDATEEPTEEATEEQEDETPSEEDLEDAGVDGVTYTSPTFDYTLEWDEDDWEVADASSDDDVDTLVLVSDASTLTITGLEDFDGDPADCLEALAEDLEDGPDVEDFEPALDRDGDPIEIDEDDRAGAVFVATVDGEDVVFRVECRVLDEDEAVLQIVQEVPRDDYNDEIGLVSDLLDTINLEDEEPEADEDDEEIPVPDDEDEEDEDQADEGGVDGNTYTSPNFGYSLEWDEDDWTPAEDTSEPGADFLVLNGRSSGITIWGLEEFGGDPLVCFSSLEDFFSSDIEGLTVEDWEPFEDEDGDVIEGQDDDRVFGAFLGTFANEDGIEDDLIYYIDCRILVEDEAVLIILQIVDPRAWEIESERREEILDTLELPGADADDEDEEEQTPDTDDDPAPDDEDDDNGRDRIDAPDDRDLQTYTSNLFDYTVAWDRDVWSLTDRDVDDDRDFIEITGESGFLTFDGQVRFNGDPADCLNTAITNLQALDGVEDWQRVRDPSLLPEGSGGRDSASALFSFTLAPEGRTPTLYYAYVDCRVLVPGESVLAIVYTVPAEDYEAERDDLGAVLRAIDLPGD